MSMAWPFSSGCQKIILKVISAGFSKFTTGVYNNWK